MSFIIDAEQKTVNRVKIHRFLMYFFLVGYIATIFLIVFDFDFIFEILIASIFLCGAIFVSVGIKLQAEMLNTINNQHINILNKNKQLIQTEDVTIFTLAYQAEIRDHETGQHIVRTAHYVQLLTEEMCKLPKFQAILTPEHIADIIKTAPLHDIGKVGVPDRILRKKGNLTNDEFIIIQKHCEFGAKILKNAQNKLSFKSFLNTAIDIAESHHERWDGKGYPHGLTKEKIPLCARIMSIADVYDALRCKRYYKQPISHEDTVKIILDGKGTQFDPDVINSFILINNKFNQIASLFEDKIDDNAEDIFLEESNFS